MTCAIAVPSTPRVILSTILASDELVVPVTTSVTGSPSEFVENSFRVTAVLVPTPVSVDARVKVVAEFVIAGRNFSYGKVQYYFLDGRTFLSVQDEVLLERIHDSISNLAARLRKKDFLLL